jgi:hypothetical protein
VDVFTLLVFFDTFGISKNPPPDASWEHDTESTNPKETAIADNHPRYFLISPTPITLIVYYTPIGWKSQPKTD